MIHRTGDGGGGGGDRIESVGSDDGSSARIDIDCVDGGSDLRIGSGSSGFGDEGGVLRGSSDHGDGGSDLRISSDCGNGTSLVLAQGRVEDQRDGNWPDLIGDDDDMIPEDPLLAETHYSQYEDFEDDDSAEDEEVGVIFVT